ncbi:hypothetical protein OH77DRAFT_1415388 [Trametes cingulata]|nr:hypothetical protein OH77DRAFT_1415388 [Trametes cingulata]
MPFSSCFLCSLSYLLSITCVYPGDGGRRELRREEARSPARVETSPAINRVFHWVHDGRIPDETSSASLIPTTTHELLNVFFAHCHPQRMVVHEPSIFASICRQEVPAYLILAMCAVAAPLSRTTRANAALPRLAGVPFFLQASRLMFDGHGALVCPPSIHAVQALCLLEMHEINANHSWTSCYRYFDLALQVMEGNLYIHYLKDAQFSTSTDPESIARSIDRECIGRCYWLIYLLESLKYIYTHQPVNTRLSRLSDMVPLPVDETRFALVAWYNSSSAWESLDHDSRFRHLKNIVDIFGHAVTTYLTKEATMRESAIASVRSSARAWLEGLPQYLQFTEENFEIQVTSLQTSFTLDAWCFCFMHVMYSCCELTILESTMDFPNTYSWPCERLSVILSSVGVHARNTLLMPCALWFYSRHDPHGPLVDEWDRSFEELWGFKIVMVAQQWRLVQASALGTPTQCYSPQVCSSVCTSVYQQCQRGMTYALA